MHVTQSQQKFDVTPFAGTAEELSNFVVRSWKDCYGGKMFVPHWSADYFRWQIQNDKRDCRRRMMAAYDDGKLVGVIGHVPLQFELNGERLRAAQASWLSVSPEYRGQGVARCLNERMRRLLREQELRFNLGYGYFGSSASHGVRFWRKQKRDTTFAGSLGFWTRVIDPQRLGGWELNRLTGSTGQVLGPFLGVPKPRKIRNLKIRQATASDLPQILHLSREATNHCDLRVVWGESQLKQQIGLNGFAESLVAEVNGEVRGCVAFHVLPIQGGTLEPVGIIDLVFVSELSRKQRTELLNRVLLRFQERGAVVALKLRSGDYPWDAFFNWGWAPMPASSHTLLTWADKPPRHFNKPRRLHVLWR